MNLPKPHRITPCGCGATLCKQVFVDITDGDSRFDPEMARKVAQIDRLLLAAERALEILRERGMWENNPDIDQLELVIRQARGLA